MSTEEFCPNCEACHPVCTQDRTETYTVRGTQIAVKATVEICSACGQAIFEEGRDQRLLAEVYAQYRAQAGLLTPEEIRAIRGKLDLSQRGFAALLGMSQATINRYEGGALQEKTHDTMIRSCSTPDFVRGLLAQRGHLLSDRQCHKVEVALGSASAPQVSVSGALEGIECACTSDAVGVETGFRPFSYRRYAAAVRWLCERLGSVGATKMNKLLFYADSLHFKTAAVSLTGSAYRNAPHGPVPANYDMLRGRMEAEGIITLDEVVYPGGYEGEDYRVGPEGLDAAAELDATAVAVLETVASRLGHLSATALREMSHQEPAYAETEDRKLISYAHAMRLSLSMPA